MELQVYDVNAKEWIAPSTCVSNVQLCGSKKCLCCNSFNTDRIYESFSTGRRFILNYPCTFTCKSRHVIYLITCKSCGVQYVGQTRQPLHCRLNGHRQSVKKNHLNTYLSNHFKGHNHSWDDVSIQIIDYVDVENKSDSEIALELNKKEDFHIRTLNTLHPLGLNDRVMGGGCASQDTATSFAFFSSPINRRKRCRGVRRSGRKRCCPPNDCEDILKKLEELMSSNNLREFYRCLKSINNNTLKALYNKLLDKSNDLSFVFTTYVNRKLFANRKDDSVGEKSHVVIPFKSHQIDQLNLRSVLYDKSVCTLVPDKVKHLYPPKVYHSLNNPICLKFCNYNKFLNGLNMQEVKDILQSNCFCNSMTNFIYEPYGHVFTGNLDIVKNLSLKSLFAFGAKHRLSKSLSWNTVQKEIDEALNKHISSVSSRNNLDAEDFSDWKQRILTLIKHRIFRCKLKSINKIENGINMKEIEKDLENLHKNLVIVPVDKASNNFSFICKKFYLKVLMDELGFDVVSSNPVGNITYAPTQMSEGEVITKHVKDMKTYFNINISDKDTKLPKLFWIPKLHKNPYKFRFIAGARNCTTKRLSVKLNHGLKTIRENFFRYCESIKKNTGYSYFWSVASTQDFLKNISNVNVHSLQVFDFSTLYTNLDQDAIKHNIFSVLDLTFNSTSRKYLCIGYEKSFFSKIKYKGYSCFDLELFKKAIDLILSEVFICFSGFVFKQIRGVPMGGNCSPLLADLFLLNCEFSYMKQLVKEKKFGLAKLLSNTSRYIDDICVVNYKHFNSLIPKIYPADLVADRNGENDKNVVYLDVRIKINNDGLQTTLYHKVEDFNFPVVLLTFPNSAIPYNMGINVFAGQVLRYCRICSHLPDLIFRINKTLLLMSNRGYSKSSMKISTERILTNHSDVLFKFGFFSARQLTSQCEF